jgi:predicted DNA-binding transcriptional regulator YafY
VRDAVGRWATVEEVGDERCVLRMSVDVLDWPIMVLGSVGAEFEVLAPPELHARLQEWSERFGRARLRGPLSRG